LRSSALKCLAIHTSADQGRPGPDYEYGWGLLNTAVAAYTLGQGDLHVHDSLLLEQDGEIRIPVYYKQNESCPAPLKATICWTDPAADTLEVNQSVLNNTTPRLINDVDLYIEGPGGTTTHYPWRLGGLADPTANAIRTEGRNSVDNVEQVLIDAPDEGWHTIVINHGSGITLEGGAQIVSLVVTGNSKPLQMSSSVQTLEGNNQRKVDYGDDTSWCQVHESAGEVYYTRSSDQGANWSEEHILSGGGGVSSKPSIFASAAGIFATWKEGSTIQACVIPPDLPPDTCWASLYPPPVPLLKSDFGDAFPPSSDAGPVIAAVLMPTFPQGVPYELVVYETEFEGNVGLAYLWLHGPDLQDYGLIQVADNDPDNPPVGPSLAFDKYKQFTDYQPEFHLAWRKADTIKYAKLRITSVNPLTIDYTQPGDINESYTYPVSGNPSVCPYRQDGGPGDKSDAVIAYRVNEDQFAGIQIALKDSSKPINPDSLYHYTETVYSNENVWSPSVMSFYRNERNGSPDNISCAFNYDDGNDNYSIQVIKTTNDGGSWTLMLAQTGDAENPSLVAFPPPGEELQIHTILRQPDDDLTQITATTYLLQKRAIQLPPTAPSSVFLEQNYPNPFNPETEIAFSVAIPQRIRLSVHDCFGREVSVLQDGEVEAGRHVLRFSARGVPSGALFCRLKTEGTVLTKAMILLK